MAPRISLQVPVGLPHLGPGKVPQGQAEAASTFPPFCELVPVLETHVLLISFNVASEVITLTSRLRHPLRSHCPLDSFLLCELSYILPKDCSWLKALSKGLLILLLLSSVVVSGPCP